MKIRAGFVSNSSSSSFTCDVCGEEVSGWDMCLSEAEMYECENQHTFCENHTILPNDDKELLINILNVRIEGEDKKYPADEERQLLKDINEGKKDIDYEDELDNYEYRYSLPNQYCPICSFKVISDSNLVEYLIKTTGISKISAFEYIKRENKRRKKLHDNEYIEYVTKQLNKNEKAIRKEVLGKFKNYEEFYKFLQEPNNK